MPIGERPLTTILAIVTLSTSFLVAATVSQVDFPGAVSTRAGGINNRGDIVGAWFDGATEHGYVFTMGAFTTLDVPGARGTHANGINDRGQVVGWYVIGLQAHGFLWEKGTFTFIDVPGAFHTFVDGINNRGQIVGRFDPGVGAGRGVRPPVALNHVPEPGASIDTTLSDRYPNA
jgi:probable HAF family extracellular repeat protein